MVELGRGNRGRRWWLWLAAGLALLVGAFLLLQPRVLTVMPAEGSVGVQNSTPIVIRFNRPMDQASVERRLEIEPDTAGRYRWQANSLKFEPAANWPEGEVIQVRLRRGALSALSLPLISGHIWQFQISQPRLVYLTNQTGLNQLALRVLSESESELLVESPFGILDYQLAVDSSSLITVEAQQDGSNRLLRRDLQGKLVEELQTCPANAACRQPALAPAGRWLAWQQQTVGRSSTGVREPGPWQVFLLDLERAGSPLLLQADGELHSPRWVGESRLAVYSEDASAIIIFELSAQGDDWQQVSQIRHRLGEQWTWSPDGRFVIFPEIILLDSPSNGVEFYSHLFRIEAESGLSTDLSGAQGLLVEDASPAYSLDGLRVAFARKSLEPEEWSLGRQLWVMAADGSEARPLTNQPNINHASFQWQDSGERLAYVRFNQAGLDTPTEVWWYDFNSDQHTLLATGGFSPQWMP